MINYQLGKVYKIVGNDKIYIGSTCKRLLCQRLAGHNANYKSYQKGKGHYITSFQCISDSNHYIELLELCPCNSKDELHKCERKWIEQLVCVNKCLPCRTQKEHYEVNKDKFQEQHKEYRETHKEQHKEYDRQRYLNNKDKIKEQVQQYYNTHKEQKKEQRRQLREKAKTNE